MTKVTSDLKNLPKGLLQTMSKDMSCWFGGYRRERYYMRGSNRPAAAKKDSLFLKLRNAWRHLSSNR